MLLSAILTVVGCTKDDDPHGRGFDPYLITEAHITDSTYYSDKSFSAYNFVYPSQDPYGNDVMLSGTITIGDEVKDSTYAKGLLLYNHYTVYRADQCPSKGNLSEQKSFSLLSLITISPDYYGFGATESISKRYTLEEIDAMIGPLTVDQYTTEAMRDSTSSLSNTMMAALDLDNLCKGWTPRGNEKIMLFHSSLDDYVPVVNTENMYSFLIENGLPSDNIDLDIEEIGPSGDTPAHKKAATSFGFKALATMIALMNGDK